MFLVGTECRIAFTANGKGFLLKNEVSAKIRIIQNNSYL